MNPIDCHPESQRKHQGFTLVEMLVVIAIMCVLMTAGAIGLNGMGGNGVTSGVASTESLFDEARTIAVSKRTNARVLIAKELANSPSENLRRILVISADVDPATGVPTSNWTLSSRGTLLPEQTYFSKIYSKKDLAGSGAAIEEMPSLAGAKASFAGSYYYYEFNAEGICTSPGASFVIGSGTRKVNVATDPPKVTSAGKRDFGGFVVWRNGRTSLFRSPNQIDKDIKDLKPGAEF